MQNTFGSLRNTGSRIRTACCWTFDFLFLNFVEGCLDFRKDSRARSDHICGLFGPLCPRCEADSNIDIPDILVMHVRCPPGIKLYPMMDRRWIGIHTAYLRQCRRLSWARYQRQLETGESMEETTNFHGTM